MTKAVSLPPKKAELVWCRESRKQNAEALRQYEFGGKRCYVNDIDVTRDHIADLRRIIRDQDRQIERLERDA